MTETSGGKLITGILVGTAILIAIRSHKQPGFWIGVGAMFLASISVRTYNK